MKQVLLVMYRKMLSDALIQHVSGSAQFSFYAESNYRCALLSAEIVQPAIAVVEIPESGEWTAERCLALCDCIRRSLPDCRMVALCPEENESICLQVIAAKKAGRLDDFLYYDTSINYLLSKLESL